MLTLQVVSGGGLERYTRRRVIGWPVRSRGEKCLAPTGPLAVGAGPVGLLWWLVVLGLSAWMAVHDGFLTGVSTLVGLVLLSL